MEQTMEMQASMGWFIPLWILGAPLVAGLIAWFSAPKTTTHHDSSVYAQGVR
jgi:hypothetical protein